MLKMAFWQPHSMQTPATPAHAGAAQPVWTVICLCAQWCGACREWQPAFEQWARSHPQLRFRWVDIEDEADALGDPDIETFPTLLIAHGATPRFYGPVQPQAAQADRLLASLMNGPINPAAPVSAEAHALAQRLL